MDDLANARYLRMSPGDVARAGPGIVTLDEAGRIVLSVVPLEPTGILSPHPSVRDLIPRRRKLVHPRNDVARVDSRGSKSTLERLLGWRKVGS